MGAKYDHRDLLHSRLQLQIEFEGLCRPPARQTAMMQAQHRWPPPDPRGCSPSRLTFSQNSSAFGYQSPSASAYGYQPRDPRGEYEDSNYAWDGQHIPVRRAWTCCAQLCCKPLRVLALRLAGRPAVLRPPPAARRPPPAAQACCCPPPGPPPGPRAAL